MSLLRFTNKGIYCPVGDFYIDPWLPVAKALITHGHSDHARAGMGSYLCTHLSKNILLHRLGTEIKLETISYNEPVFINGVKISFHPAGHTVGSAQIRLEYKGFVSVVSGDYKTAYDGISTAFEPVRCNEFVTESTFGLPIYRWLNKDAITQQLRNWVTNNIQEDKTSVFFAYSLGKAQRVMKMLEGMGNIFVHYSIAKLNEAIEAAGITLPSYQILYPDTDKQQVKNQLVILPPLLLDTNVVRRIPNAATAICSGWMQVRGNRHWKAVDAGFAISDHADWDGLLQTVKDTGAEKVFVTHGYSAAFTKYLNEIGITAEEIQTQFGEEDEMDLPVTDKQDNG